MSIIQSAMYRPHGSPPDTPCYGTLWLAEDIPGDFRVTDVFEDIEGQQIDSSYFDNRQEAQAAYERRLEQIKLNYLLESTQ